MRKKTHILAISILMFIFIMPILHITVDGEFVRNDPDSNINSGLFSKKIKIEDSTSNEGINIADKEKYFDQERQLTSNMFIENKGQFNQEIMFFTKVSEIGIGFTSSKISFYDKGTEFSINFVGANSVKPKGNQFLKSYSNYYTSSLILNKVRHCTQIIYENLYDGIHLVYKFTEMGLKYDFIIEPFADVNKIQIEYLGIDSLDVESNKLIFSKTNNVIVDDQLVAWYEDTKEELSVRFSLCYNEEVGKNKQFVSFEIEANYDCTRRIIVDPLICIYSTFFGGSGNENPVAGADLGEKDLIIDNLGNILIVGRTGSEDFPIANATQGSNGGGYDVMVSKLAPDAQSLVFSSYLGGSNDEWATDVAVDSNGNVAVVGPTESGDFPVLNAIQATHNGGTAEDPNDMFIVKLNDNGTMLFSTFWGGSLDDWLYGVEFDSSGNIICAGGTSSSDYYTANAHQAVHAPGTNGDFAITKFASNGQSVIFSTFLGGSGFDSARAIEIDSGNNILVTGTTQGTTFPTYNAYQTSIEGTTACVVAKFSSSGVLQFATTLDGIGIESGYSITSDNQNNVIVGGSTTSVDFPIANATQTPIGGGLDAFITKLSADGQTLLYSTFLGGIGGDECRDIELDKDGNFLVVGHTTSTDFPIKHAYQYYYSGNYDVFISLIDKNSTLISSSYLGGSNQDQAIGVGVDPSNNIVVGGFTLSSNFPTLNALQSSISGANDLFISKFELDLTLPDVTPPNPTPTTPSTNEGTGLTAVVLFIMISLIGGSTVLYKRRKLMIKDT